MRGGSLRKFLSSALWPQLTTGALIELGKLVVAEKSAFDTGDKTLRLNLSGDFHRQLAKLAGNSVLDDFFSTS